ncbi:MAG: dienelactone hydrolase family protein [Caulobacterales bacterium]|nr:dienelactone hydrolase family protein [Caulobacterales bacterium]
MTDTVAARWAKLEPFVTAYGPDDAQVRPAVILFHGCGGLRPHLPRYAQAAVEAGWRAFVVDSYAPRGWDRNMSLTLVCTGVLLRGPERAGDVAAAVWGLAQRPDVDASRLVLAGWSHGSWSMMDLMTMRLERAGEAGLADPQTARAALDGVIGMAAHYPYLGPGALSRTRPWVRHPQVLAVIARDDHLTSVHNAMSVHDRIRRGGTEVETWIANGTHAFDEPTGLGPMNHDPELTQESLERFAAFLNRL